MENTVQNTGATFIGQLLAMQNTGLVQNPVMHVVTPEEAAQLLTINAENNRRINTANVATMAEDIKNGNFTLSPNPICISTEGKLIDGQHRLTAIVKAGKPAPLYIMFGVKPDAVIDRGVPRSVGDSIYMRGEVPKKLSSPQMIAIANRYLDIATGKTRGRKTDTQISMFLNEHGDNMLTAYDLSRHGGRIGSKARRCNKAPIQTAIFAALENGISEEILDVFIRVVNSGYSEGNKQSAAILLMNYIDITEGMSGRTASNKLCAFTQMAIHDFVNGTPRKKQYTTLRHIYINGKEQPR